MNIDYHNESDDALTDVLDTLRIEGKIFCVSDMKAPWATKKDEQKLIYFYVIENGEGIVEFANDGEKVKLSGGDLILLPHGEEHTIYNGSKDNPLILDDVFAAETVNDRHYLKYGGDGAATNFICGVFQFVNRAENTLISALPRVVRVTAETDEASRWLAPTLKLLSYEARNPRQGSASIINRLTAIIFVQAIRIWVETGGENQTGWLAALKDQQISRALNLLHQNPAANWTVAKIAASIGMSRSPFAAKFTRLVGEPPLTYLKKRRMNLALNYLRTEPLNVAEVAARVGYGSEAAFSKTFKQHFGKPPRDFKKK